MKSTQTFTTKTTSAGSIDAIFTVCEKSVHLDCFNDQYGFGHIDVATTKALIKWLKDAVKHIKKGKP